MSVKLLSFVKKTYTTTFTCTAGNYKQMVAGGSRLVISQKHCLLYESKVLKHK